MSKRVSYDVKALTKTFVDGGVTCKDIRYFLGISERTVKRHFKRGKGRLRGGFHLNQTQKEAIVDLHHKGCDIFEISRQIELPA
jgi:transposase-like protein